VLVNKLLRGLGVLRGELLYLNHNLSIRKTFQLFSKNAASWSDVLEPFLQNGRKEKDQQTQALFLRNFSLGFKNRSYRTEEKPGTHPFTSFDNTRLRTVTSSRAS
jgi:hypothetical protein